VAAIWRRRWVRWTAFAVSLPLAALFGASVYFYVSFGELIEAKLHGERDRTFPRVFARPLELHRGQSLTDRQLIDRLNDLGYAQTPKPEKPGEFAAATGTIAIMPRGADFKGQLVRVTFQKPAPVVKASVKRAPPPRKAPDRIERLEVGVHASERLTLDTPVLTSLVSGDREKRRPVALSAIPPHVIQAVLSIEDRRFYEHPGVDPIGIVGALLSNLRGKRAYTAGASTITQQVVRNIFLPRMFPGMTLQAAREKSLKRKALEAWVSVILTQRASKDEILEMYLNDMTLGQRGSFGIVGVAEASRLFFGKHVSNVTLAEAATIAGVLQSPSALSPFTNPDKCAERRNVVLGAMVDAGYVEADVAARAAKEPLVIVQRALETEAPYFVDYVGQTIADDYPGLTSSPRALDVYTTLDLHLQRLAQDSVREGLTHVDELLAHRKRHGKAEAALIALDPRTGEILAFVGGRSYNQSQYNRAIAARRQPGSVFKPFVYLTAFERAADAGQTDISPATIVDDSPTTWEYDDQVWTPENYEYTYDGPITFRHALAHSRNIAAVKVAEAAGYQNVVNLWKKLGVGTAPKPYPSIALGVFEATPYEIATAYTIFPNMGTIRPLRHVLKVTSGGKDVTKKRSTESRIVARPETTFLVTNMMRSVLNEGTAASARAEGFKLDAAGKTGTTNDLRDAWFVGFTPDLLAVVWVGFDDNQPVGLSGAKAALPIWTMFMKGALAGHASVPFDEPEGINWVEIDADTGKLAGPTCPRVIREAFLPGTEPLVACDVHRD
jgi:penicillin-binding protein 1B